MKNLMLRCPVCYKYTLSTVCPTCGTNTSIAHPARYSPDDKYARYRTKSAYSDNLVD